MSTGGRKNGVLFKIKQKKIREKWATVDVETNQPEQGQLALCWAAELLGSEWPNVVY